MVGLNFWILELLTMDAPRTVCKHLFRGGGRGRARLGPPVRSACGPNLSAAWGSRSKPSWQIWELVGGDIASR